MERSLLLASAGVGARSPLVGGVDSLESSVVLSSLLGSAGDSLLVSFHLSDFGSLVSNLSVTCEGSVDFAY